MIVRSAAASDYAEIRTVVRAAFGAPSESELVDALRKSGDAVIEMVAVTGSVVAGHVMYSKLQSPDGCLALAPVSVRPDYQRRGIASSLIRRSLDRARDADWQAVFLLGDPGYYARFGFDLARAAPFETGYPKPYFMVLELRPRALDTLDRRIMFAPPFQALDDENV